MTTTIAKVNHDFALIGGEQIAWSTLIQAAEQDRDRRTIRDVSDISRGNGEHELADSYRQILREALPLIGAAKDSAYREYCHAAVTTRGSDPAHAIGHGSWVTGPDSAKQEVWQAWERLERQIAAVVS